MNPSWEAGTLLEDGAGGTVWKLLRGSRELQGVERGREMLEPCWKMRLDVVEEFQGAGGCRERKRRAGTLMKDGAGGTVW